MPHRSILPALMVLAALAAAVASPAHAGESYDNCAGTITSLPATLTTQGVWCLKGDLSTAIASGAAITVAANNVTIDCNGFKLGGLAAGPGTETAGIYIESRQNAVVRNCNIRGFMRGIHTTAGAGHLIEHNRVVASTYAGIDVGCDGSTIRDNLVTDTGGATTGVLGAVGINANGPIDVLDNGIQGVTPGTGGGAATGISHARSGASVVRGNRIGGLVPYVESFACGICTGGAGPIIEGNLLSGPRTTDSYGIYCDTTLTTAARNTVMGFETGISGCWEHDNAVNPG